MDNERNPSDPVVSIICTTFNHEKFVERALQSFFKQKTSFTYEIVLVDDASTDKTQEIVNHYKEKYPNILKLIFRKNNQFQKGSYSGWEDGSKAANTNSKYIAICEGDDFWLSEDKLQRQYDVMSSDHEIGLSFHPTIYFDNHTMQPLGMRNNHFQKVKNLSPSVFKLNGGGYCPTASLMVKKQTFDDWPDWASKIKVQDYFLQVWATKDCKGAFIPDIYSCYRTNNINSLTSVFKDLTPDQIDEELRIELNNIESLENVLGEEYSDEFNYRKAIILKEYAGSILAKRDKNLYLKYIKASWKFKKFISPAQTMMYFLRFSIPILNLVKSYFGAGKKHGLKKLTHKQLELFKSMAN